MTIPEAKTIIRAYGYPNVAETLEAFEVAKQALGQDATMRDIWRWAERDTDSPGAIQI